MYIYANELYHYGMPRRSGRYPWGSGDRPYQSLPSKNVIRKSDMKKAWSGKRDPKLNKDHTIKKGTLVYRVELGEDNIAKGQDKSRESRPVYVSYMPQDRVMWKGAGLQSLNYQRLDKGPVKAAENTFKIKKDLKVAGRETIKDIIDENVSIMDAAKSCVESSIRRNSDAIIREYITRNPENYNSESASKYLNKVYNDYLDEKYEQYSNEKDLGFLYYRKAWTLGTNKEIKEKIIDILKDKGYDAMTDEAGVGGQSESLERIPIQGVDPLIIFDSSETTMAYKKTSGIDPKGGQYNADFDKSMDWYRRVNKKI